MPAARPVPPLLPKALVTSPGGSPASHGSLGPRVSLGPRGLLGVLAAALCLAALVALAPEARAAGADQAAGQRLLSLLPAGMYALRTANAQEFWLDLAGPEDRPLGSVRLLRSPGDPSHRVNSRSFAIEIANYVPDPSVVDTLVQTAHTIVERDDGSWATHVPNLRPVLFLGQWQATLAVVAVAAILGQWRRWKVSWEVRLPHLLPAGIQILLYAYWSLYWPDVRLHMPSLLLELVMGFAADAAFSFVRFGSWRVGASPLPIVLSANLFAWLFTPGILVTVLVAFGTKTYLRRDGRHVLNPSAAGLTAAGLCAAIAPNQFPFGGVFHQMNISPNLAELILLLAIVPQLRFRIVPVSIGALLGMLAYHNVAIHRPAVLLAIVLLATDPATIPKTDLGKILFGAFVGIGIGAVSVVLRGQGLPDDFSKVIPIPFANALVPELDRYAVQTTAFVTSRLEASAGGARLLDRLRRWCPASGAATGSGWAIPNRALVACWIALILPGFAADKRRAFEPTYYWTWGTPLVVRDADDVPRCPANPVFCRPFSFAEEAVAWRERERVALGRSW